MAPAETTTDLAHFIPFPRAVLLENPDKTQTAKCAICFDNAYYRRETNNSSDSMAILPCGHVFCQSCIEMALSVKRDECPTCRMSLRYRACSHSVEPRTLHEENVLLLPSVVRSAAELPDVCPGCRRKKAVAHAGMLYSVYSHDIQRANAAYEKSRSDAALGELSDADKKAHRVIMSSFNVRAQFDW